MVIELLILLLAVIGAVYFTKKKKTIPAAICAIVALAILILIGCAFLLISAID